MKKYAFLILLIALTQLNVSMAYAQNVIDAIYTAPLSRHDS